MNELKWCPVQGLVAAILSAVNKNAPVAPICVAEGCGAFHFCTAGKYVDSPDDEDFFEECETCNEFECTCEEVPETVEGEDGNPIEVLPRNVRRLAAMEQELRGALREEKTAFTTITCVDCDGASMCEFAFQKANIDGHCLAEK